jgi:hypothetical protein
MTIDVLFRLAILFDKTKSPKGIAMSVDAYGKFWILPNSAQAPAQLS